jgi:peptidoglycan hydrolase CwlO-like protein
MQLTEEQMRARFWAATAEQEAAEAKVAPLHEQREALSRQQTDLQEQIRTLNREIKRAERPVIELQQERVNLSRWLGSKVGVKPE